MQSVGICGSDISFFKKGRIGDFVLTKPLILGHEASAIVTAIGDGVTSLVPGTYMQYIEPTSKVAKKI